IDDYDQRLHKYLIDLAQKNELMESDTIRVTGYLDIINDLERIGDHLNNIGELISVRYEYGLLTPEMMQEELKEFYDLIDGMMVDAFKAFETRNLKLAVHVIDKEVDADRLEKQFKHNHTQRLQDGTLVLSPENNYVDILANLERIADHLTNISETVLLLYETPAKRATVFGK
ncbi:MAG: Na/Pi cotransporter family protein, partial [Acholeplasmataceae bacterium]|nr:Na/Pi cotransporter family protein [Acholeplasmataceae bacterium]